MTYKEMQKRSIEVVDKKIEELLDKKNAIIERLSYSLPVYMRNMTTGVRMMEFRYIADKDDNYEMKRDLMEIDDLRRMIREMMNVRDGIRKLC